MNTIKNNIKEIASWQCPDGYIPTDAVISPSFEVNLLNSSNYYFSMSKTSSEMSKQIVGKEMVRVERMGNNRYLVLTYENDDYTCYISNTLSLENATVVDLGSSATEIAFNENKNEIWFVNTSKELRVYNLDSKTVTKISDLSLKSVYLSENNEYVAFEDVNGIVYYTSTNDVKNPVSYKSEENTEVLGISDSGALVVMELSLAMKNSNNSSENPILMIEKDKKTTLTMSNYSWGILKSNHLVTFDSNKTVKLLELLGK